MASAKKRRGASHVENNSTHEKGLLRFIQTPNWSDVKIRATGIGLDGSTPKGDEKNPELGASSPRDKRPSVSDYKASKSSDLPELNKKGQPQWSRQSGWMNDPKACKDFEGASFPYLEKLAAFDVVPLELLKLVEPVASEASTD